MENAELRNVIMDCELINELLNAAFNGNNNHSFRELILNQIKAIQTQWRQFQEPNAINQIKQLIVNLLVRFAQLQELLHLPSQPPNNTNLPPLIDSDEVPSFQSDNDEESTLFANMQHRIRVDGTLGDSSEELQLPAMSPSPSPAPIRRQDQWQCTETGCEKVFKSKASRHEHYKTHVGLYPYICTYGTCSRAYFHRDKVVNHVCKVHLRTRRDCTKAQRLLDSEKYIRKDDQILLDMKTQLALLDSDD